MSLPETDVARVRRWGGEQNERIGEHIDEMRVEMDVEARAITILECRPPWREDFGPEWTRQEIARMRYTKSTGVWTLYWPDRHRSSIATKISTRPRRSTGCSPRSTPTRSASSGADGW